MRHQPEFIAYCSCGWESPVYSLPALSLEAFREHVMAHPQDSAILPAVGRTVAAGEGRTVRSGGAS